MHSTTKHSRSGFFRLGLLRLLLPIAVLWGGGQALYTALTNRKAVSTTFVDYLRERPSGEWVELRDARLDLVGAAISSRVGVISKAYIPLHAPGEAEDAKIQVLLLTNDSKTLDLLKEMSGLDEKRDEQAAVSFLRQHQGELRPLRTVSGLVQFGIESSGDTRRKLAKLEGKLARDFLIIEEGEKPNLGMAVTMLVLGFVAAWFCWFRRSGSPKSNPPPLPQNPPPLPQTPPPLPTIRGI